MDDPVLRVRFYLTDMGVEPVRVWLRALSGRDRKTIGAAIVTVQFGWPLGMPLVRKLDVALWEVRVHLEGRIARVLFTVYGHDMVLLHGFIKKSQATPKDDLALAKDRLKSFRSVQ
jgi:phage-related protein